MNKKLTTFLALALSLVMICSTPLSALASDDLSYSSIAESPQVTCEDTSDTSAEIPGETVAEDPEDPSANIPAEPLIESPSEKHVEFQVNPIYSDIFSPEDFTHTEPSGESLVGKDRLNATSIEEFTTLYRNAFNELARSRCDNIDSYKSVTVYCTLERDTVFTDEEMDAIEKQCTDIAMANQFLHTGDPVLGDYASYHVSSWELSSGKYVYCDVDDPNFPDVPYYLEVEVTTKMWYLSTTA